MDFWNEYWKILKVIFIIICCYNTKPDFLVFYIQGTKKNKVKVKIRITVRIRIRNKENKQGKPVEKKNRETKVEKDPTPNKSWKSVPN